MQKKHSLKTKNFLLAATVLSSLALSTGARAEVFTFVRPGDPDVIFKQNDPLVIVLPENLNNTDMTSLFVELDGVDVTQMISLDGLNAVFNPASPYASGKHVLRLVRMGRNNKLVEINRWNFTVAGGEPPVVNPASVNGSIDATYSYMAHNNSDSENLDPHNLQTQAQVSAAGQKDSWQFSAQGNGFYNTDDMLTPSGKDHGEVGEYLLRAENSTGLMNSVFSLGHHDIGMNNLLADNFYRRGGSAVFDYNGGQAQLAGFSMNPSSAIGNENISGIGQKERRVEGVHAVVQPLQDKVTLEGTFYSGDGDGAGAGVGSTSSLTVGGTGMQLGLNANIIENYLGLRTQYAHSKFDGDGLGLDESAKRDDAYETAITFTPLGRQLTDDGRIRSWTLTGRYQQIGSYFETLLNPTSEQDRESWGVESAYALGGFSVDSLLEWVQDNVNDFSAMPRNRALNAMSQISYAPETEMFGMPIFALGASLSDEGRMDTPAAYAGTSLDRRTLSLNGGVTLTIDATVFSFNHTYTHLNDEVDSLADYDTHFTDLNFEFHPDERVTVRPGLQAEFTNEDVDGFSSAYHASLGTDVVIIPDKFWNNTNVSILLNDGNTPQDNTHNAETEFTWLLKEADTNSPGYAVAISGLYDNDSSDDEETRGFVRLKVSAPFAF